MKSNDTPPECLALRLRDADIAALLQFLHELTDALDRRYTAELIRRNYPQHGNSPDEVLHTNPADPPF